VDRSDYSSNEDEPKRRKKSKLVCESCGMRGLELFDVRPWFYCKQCSDARLLRERFKAEAHLFEEQN
jgi:hypothetical protein